MGQDRCRCSRNFPAHSRNKEWQVQVVTLKISYMYGGARYVLIWYFKISKEEGLQQIFIIMVA